MGCSCMFELVGRKTEKVINNVIVSLTAIAILTAVTITLINQ